MSISVVMAAGGTGGHLVPALAIADAVRALEPDSRISFVGTGRGLTDDVVARAGYRAYTTAVQPFTKSARGLLGPLSMVPATAQARRILREVRADVVVGMGGYPSLPVIGAARLAKIPSIIHEANAIPGLANEWAARVTPNIAVAFPDAMRAFKGKSPRLVGMPLRDEIVRFDRDALRAEALRSFDLDPQRATLLVFGGSLGAARLTDAAIDLAARWAPRDDRQIVLIAGAREDGAIGAARGRGVMADAAAGPGVVLRVRRFVAEMHLAYAAADVVVGRAGASTVAELAIVGVPSVLVPLPHARRKEQHANARTLADIGAALMLEDADVTGERLDQITADLLADDERRAKIGAVARTVARPNAAREMASWIVGEAGAHA